VGKASSQLQSELKLISTIEPYVERPDLARLYVLKQASQRVLDLIAGKGLANMATIREYQVLIVTYRYSTSFFKKIETEETSEAIKSLLTINEQIVADRGFDDSPYTQLTLSTIGQMYKLFQDLSKLPITPEFKKSIDNLVPDFGNVMAIAKQGDRPKTFEAAKALYFKVVALYPLFQQVAASNEAYDLTLGIQGLAEFYAEYAQIDPAGNP